MAKNVNYSRELSDNVWCEIMCVISNINCWLTGAAFQLLFDGSFAVGQRKIDHFNRRNVS